ncbi:MAG: hypothetical protein JW783_00310 [Bacteroidales bacterium]|nr:hypothetical protein [Bacteroidales bacterium]MBN2748463.1 hypothetical protein [Bacteroidales bacterium]
MNTLNKDAIEAVAKDVFNRYPKAQKVAVTSDGMAFIVDNGDNAVKNHATKNRSGKELKIYNFTRDEVKQPKSSDRAEDLIALIGSCNTVSEVESIKAKEASGKNRSTVIQAAEARVNELKKD